MIATECPCGGKGWMWCPECRRVDAARLYTGIAKNCCNHRPVPTCPTCLLGADGQCSGVGACNLPIKEGQRITRMSDGTYRHVGCAS